MKPQLFSCHSSISMHDVFWTTGFITNVYVYWFDFKTFNFGLIFIIIRYIQSSLFCNLQFFYNIFYRLYRTYIDIAHQGFNYLSVIYPNIYLFIVFITNSHEYKVILYNIYFYIYKVIYNSNK